ncbi:hypothetical protein AYO20_07704 [Fonsecaea nubica]|uniref:Protein kinase domain-containing protein n=1 Tax=Fonsecaea nubica TaxID=856822 RepID=A0A178CUV0_9EURO|nr:hypothetical protein AYO20_07704 [Fonsecaea nubica]OAL32913.1 hypothetical protein AYO20_07704 [Fonsecaea nubica]
MPSHHPEPGDSFPSPPPVPPINKAAPLDHWEEEFFDGTDIPRETYRAWVSDEEAPLRFQSTLRLIRPLNDPPLGASAQVWLAVSDLGAFAVKLYTPYTDEDAAAQAGRLPHPKPSIQKVLHDCHPFVLETRAYERIRKSCPPSQRFFFLRYYGIVDSPLLPPPYQRDRIRMLKALQKLGISHGDVKPDCFGLPESPHYIALYDLGRSYTFSPDRPCITNGTRRLRPLKLAEKVDCRNAQHTVLKMVKSGHLFNHFKRLLGTTEEDTRKALRLAINQSPLATDLPLILLSGLVEDDGPFFPSLSSILPFLEPAASGRKATWTVALAHHLDRFVAVSCSDVKPCAVASMGVRVASLVSSTGVVIEQLRLLCPEQPAIPTAGGRSMVALLPSAWLQFLDTRRFFCALYYSNLTT